VAVKCAQKKQHQAVLFHFYLLLAAYLLAFFGKVTAAFFLLVMCDFALLFGAGELILEALAGAASVELAAKAGATIVKAPSTINDVSLVFMSRSLSNMTIKSRVC
jgi:hypothetical protein